MEEIIERFTADHEGVVVTTKEHEYVILNDNSVKETKTMVRYNIENVPGLEGFYLQLREENDFDSLARVLADKPQLFKDMLAVRFGNTIEVYLRPIGYSSHKYRKRENPVEVKINYKRNELDIQIQSKAPADSHIGLLAGFMRGIRPPRRVSDILTITGLEQPTSEGIESDVRNIINSVLFDIECSYGLVFEHAEIDSLKHKRAFSTERHDILPTEEVNLLYKEYIPELIEYFHIAQKVDYLPFKYICYFHIVEYFMDKVAHEVVSRQLMELMSNPDFHIRSKEYISQAIIIFKKENEKYTTDKIKIGRVLREFTQKEPLLAHLDVFELSDHFQSDHQLHCSNVLNLSAIDTSNDNSFYDTLTKRIYSLRCSIVHSNPDFDASKAVPFVSSPQNIEFLRKEIALLQEISKRIIINSAA